MNEEVGTGSRLFRQRPVRFRLAGLQSFRTAIPMPPQFLRDKTVECERIIDLLIVSLLYRVYTIYIDQRKRFR